MNDDYINTGRKNQKQETRDKIIESAQYFLNKGIEFNLEDVAGRTGVSRATIYRYYSNVQILAEEAGLDINTLHPEHIIENVQNETFENKVLGIQDYFNTLAIDNENAFRKYLSIVIASNPSEIKRGARRKKTMQLAFENTNFTKQEEEDLTNLLIILMGIEPLIITKDVSGLDNKESLRLMKWGMKLILKGLEKSKEEQKS
ncbi:TetR/AcrR family transcriptional regulator [Maribacter sp. 1_2014MBL_MicDiv]|uniref:TetR/AcrR family transcriptional regulator n=1 Tax=Maribacter sp. 1_2014MBL_MicDiv TaxID=1644130 RepID=UPI0008F46F94|nr:TetR/AcrR family transcriptional regulator [Maribacter sp. 1_2014MBL_MicDiv]APA64156.1 TetR family transcriptional regulator [Maribacter sp. 1_2014MBL_MicDiv]